MKKTGGQKSHDTLPFKKTLVLEDLFFVTIYFHVLFVFVQVYIKGTVSRHKYGVKLYEMLL